MKSLWKNSLCALAILTAFASPAYADIAPLPYPEPSRGLSPAAVLGICAAIVIGIILLVKAIRNKRK